MKSTWPGVSIRFSSWPFHVDAHGLRLDRDPALALEVHRVEHLRAHLAAGDGVGQLEDAVGQRRLAVVDVGDDREVADVALVHGFVSRGGAAAGATRAAPAARALRAPGTAARYATARRRAPAAERDELAAERAAERVVERHQTAKRDAAATSARRGDDPHERRARSRAKLDPAEPPAQQHEQRGRAGDVHERRRERDAPGAEAVERRRRAPRSARGSPSATAGRDPVRLQAEEGAVQHQHRAVEDEPGARTRRAQPATTGVCGGVNAAALVEEAR